MDIILLSVILVVVVTLLITQWIRIELTALIIVVLDCMALKQSLYARVLW